MGDALNSCGRKIVYSLCQYGRADVWKWGPEVGGNLWRTTGDIRDTWESMAKIGFGQADLAPYAGPGHWNDPDMLEIGNGGMTTTEYKTHMSLWSLLAAPLLAGNDLQHMEPEILEILTNKDVIAIDQDPAGKQATRVAKNGDTEIWVKQLHDGSRAVGIFNLGQTETNVSAKWADIGVTRTPKRARDLWLHKEVPLQDSGASATVPSHGVALLQISK
jgi:alpha-galactosidase